MEFYNCRMQHLLAFNFNSPILIFQNSNFKGFVWRETQFVNYNTIGNKFAVEHFCFVSANLLLEKQGFVRTKPENT
jgi:hypothetical protein